MQLIINDYKRDGFFRIVQNLDAIVSKFLVARATSRKKCDSNPIECFHVFPCWRINTLKQTKCIPIHYSLWLMSVLVMLPTNMAAMTSNENTP